MNPIGKFCIEKGRGETFKIPLWRIKIVFNLREEFDQELIDRIATDMLMKGQDNVSVKGQRDPATVYPDDDGEHVVIFNGETRYRAVLRANEMRGEEVINYLLCRPCKKPANLKEVVFGQLGHNLSSPLKESEIINGLRKLIDSGECTIKEIAAETGYAASWISAHLTVVSAPAEVRAAVENKTMSQTAVVEFTRASEEKKKNLIEKAKSGKKVRVKDVQIEVKGHAAQIPARHVEEMIRAAAANYSALKDTDLIEADKWFFAADILRKVVNQENIELIHKHGE